MARALSQEGTPTLRDVAKVTASLAERELEWRVCARGARVALTRASDRGDVRIASSDAQ